MHAGTMNPIAEVDDGLGSVRQIRQRARHGGDMKGGAAALAQNWLRRPVEQSRCAEPSDDWRIALLMMRFMTQRRGAET
jgi:hypothetical protein